MPNLKQVIDVLETLYPLRYAEEWDEPGLIVGDLSHDVHRIVFAADPTSAIIDKAIATGADLLITHHPLFFRSVRDERTRFPGRHRPQTLPARLRAVGRAH